jgi:hypothetical protein
MFKFILGMVLAASCVHAGQADFGSASVAAPWLKLSSSAREAALGGAGSAFSGSLENAGVNPAGLAGMKGLRASFTHNAWLQDSALEHVAFGMNLLSGGGALSVDSFSYGSLDRYGIENGLPVAQGSFTPSSLQAGLAYGLELGDFSLGLGGKIVSQSIDTSSGSAFAGDLGGLWRPGIYGLALGLSLRNLGSQMQGADLPRVVTLGAAYSLNSAIDNEVNLAGDVHYPLADSRALSVSLGGEYWFKRMAAFRLGYKLQDRGSLAGLSGLNAGLGGRYQWLRLDYAFTALGDLGTGNLATLSVAF